MRFLWLGRSMRGIASFPFPARRRRLPALVGSGLPSDAFAVDAVGWEDARRRIRAAANLWLLWRKDAGCMSLRFDIIASLPRRFPSIGATPFEGAESFNKTDGSARLAVIAFARRPA